MAKNGRINKVLMKDQGGMRGDKFPKGSIPGRGGVSRAYRVVPSSDIKGEAKLKAKLLSISPEEKTSLGSGEHLLNKSEDILDLLSKVGMWNTKALEFGQAIERWSGDIFGDPSFVEGRN